MKSIIVGIALAIAAYASSTPAPSSTHSVARTYRMDTTFTAPEATTQPTVTLSPVVIAASPKHKRSVSWTCGAFRPLEMGDGYVRECSWR